jgi:ABC-type Zn uptake system ZnuABC Zn-binding protein ZnuA
MHSRSVNHLVRFLLSFTLVLFVADLAQGQHHERHRRRARHRERDCGRCLSVVTSLAGLGSIASYVGGDSVQVSPIALGNQDPHFVQPKPSYAQLLAEADLFVTTGLDLELWVPTLLDKARNPRIYEGGVGYVSAATDVPLLEKPALNLDRAMGDVHTYGNPHIHTSPLNAKRIAQNIRIGLKKVAPGQATAIDRRYGEFVTAIDSALFGKELVELFGGELLSRMLESGQLIDFLESREYEGVRLIDMLGGWLRTGLPFRGKKVICYHKNWVYFARDFGLLIVNYVEPKPGIPPTAKHVKKIIETINSEKIQVMVVANYFEKHSPEMVAERTGITPVFLPLDVAGTSEVPIYFDLVDYWIRELNTAFDRAAQSNGS